MQARFANWLWVGTIAGLVMALPARAEIPPSCAAAPCNIESEFVIFNSGTSERIVATFMDCANCVDPGGGTNYELEAILEIDFGPYDPASSCVTAGDSNLARIEFAGTLRPSPQAGPTEHYYPDDPNEFYDAWPVSGNLYTECVDAAWLNYTIPLLRISDADGAWTDTSVSSGTATMLTLPENVRSSYGSSFAMPQFQVNQDLTFSIAGTLGPSSDFRFWPEGLPFTLGPYDFEFTQDRGSWGHDAVLGPTPYEVIPPDTSTLVADGYHIFDCADPDPSEPCSSTPIWNAGYLDSPNWTPDNASFDVDGLDVDVGLASGESVVYRPLFPHGTWLKLDGIAAIRILDSAIFNGSFDVGKAWLQTREGLAWCDNPYPAEFDLRGGSGTNPQLTRDGGIVAGVATLNPYNGGTSQSVRWLRNEASGLGCGTLYVPPLVNAALLDATIVGPQREWLRSAEADDLPGILADPVRGRGIYAGFNYNRNKICTAGDPSLIGTFCALSGDCGAGGVCAADHWSPSCPAIPITGFQPTWSTYFQDNHLVRGIHPKDSGEEMAFYARASGVTGVFDAGNEIFSITQPFDMEFNSFGHAFRASKSEWADTIIRGGLEFDWPSDTTIPFNDMTMCNCGSAKGAGSGEPPTENRLAYWDATFYPYGLTFLESPGDDCAVAAPSACADDVADATAVCVEATMPIPHFRPVPTVKFRVDSTGSADQIVPLDTPVFEFESFDPPHALSPYEYAAEEFRLNDWAAAGSPTKTVVTSGGEPYGYYDSKGDIALPLFGQVPAGIQVRSIDGWGVYDVNMHEEGDPDDPLNASSIDATKKAASETLDLSYRVDYFRPESTADPDDGADEYGRGLMLGYSGLEDADRNIDLGSIEFPSSVIMTPDTIVADVGVSASMRLWALTEGDGRAQLDTILPAVNLQPPAVSVYEAALGTLAAYFGGIPWYALPPPDDNYIGWLYDSGAIQQLAGHPTDNVRAYRTSAHDPGMNASNLTGFLTFANNEVEQIFVDANMDTNGQFFAMDRSTLTVDRHVKHNSPAQPIAQLGRRTQPGNMALPGEMSVPFPDIPPGLQWDFDYDFSGGTPVFKSLTGSLDLTKGGLSGIGFDRAGMTLKFWNDGDWYFDAGLKLKFNGYSAFGDILLGNTKNLDPLWAKDPTVADFLGPIPSFKGGYVRVGASGRIFDYGCLLRVGAGFEVGGWYITDSYGGKLRGWVTGRGACLVSVRGDLTLMGGAVGDRFKMTGFMWVGGGLGFCEEEDWDTPQDVLDDDWCGACVISGSITGITPPKFKLSMDGPDAECAP